MNIFSLADIRIAWRNLGRNPRRTVLAWSAIAIALIALIWMEGFINGYRIKIFDAVTGPMLGHLQIHAQKYREDSAIERVIPGSSAKIKLIESQEGVRSVSPRVYAPVLASLKELGHIAYIIGIDFQTEFKTSGLLAGFKADAQSSTDVWLGSGLATDMGIHIGDEIALMGQGADGSVASGLFRVRKIVDTPIEMVNRTGILMPIRSAQEFLVIPDQVHEFVIYSKDSEHIARVTSGLEALPELKALEIRTWNQLVPQLVTMLQVAEASNKVIIVLVVLMTIAGIANTMLMATFERSREFGMLLSLGCKPSRIVRILVIESVMLGFLGAMIGAIVGTFLVVYQSRHGIDLSGLGNVKGFSFEGAINNLIIYPKWHWRSLCDGITATFFTSILATIWPARRIAKLEPAEAMRS